MALVVITGLIVAALVLLVRLKSKETKGTPLKSALDDQLIDVTYHSGGPGGGHGILQRVSKDPQKYSAAMMPRPSKDKSK